MANVSPTTGQQVLAMIDGLLNGSKSRKEVARWANNLYTNDRLAHCKAITNALENLGAVDLVASDRPYLYTNEDLVNWKRDMLQELSGTKQSCQEP